MLSRIIGWFEQREDSILVRFLAGTFTILRGIVLVVGFILMAQLYRYAAGPNCPDDSTYRYDPETDSCVDMSQDPALLQADKDYQDYLDSRREDDLNDLRFADAYQDYLDGQREEEVNRIRAEYAAEATSVPSDDLPVVLPKEGANLRSGPGVGHSKTGGLEQGTLVNIEGISADGKWYHLASGAWISAELVGNAPSGLPVTTSVVQAPALVQSCPQGCTTQPSGCVIKGNIKYQGTDKIYHLPGCQDYDKTTVNTAYGERWFCTETEAVANGWRKAYNCP